MILIEAMPARRRPLTLQAAEVRRGNFVVHRHFELPSMSV